MYCFSPTGTAEMEAYYSLAGFLCRKTLTTMHACIYVIYLRKTLSYYIHDLCKEGQVTCRRYFSLKIRSLKLKWYHSFVIIQSLQH